MRRENCLPLIHIPLHVRSAGVLLHITSLPSPYGIGDLGEEAQTFARFLNQGNQQWWQMLPLNPLGGGDSPSPYSSTSSMAGNHLLISPDALVKDGLLTKANVEAARLPNKGKASYVKATQVKEQLFALAFQKFQSKRRTALHYEFDKFCAEEKEWLDDYALYTVLKSAHQLSSWQTWPGPYKNRETKALSSFANGNEAEILRRKWLQFLFYKQWRNLKAYCNRLGIQLFGDLPFYIGEDSVDVWTHPQLFSMDKEGRVLQVAGVPPDYFSSTGQKWGMPVFNWEECKKEKYKWWKKRLQHQTKLFDVVRLDHFRAFANYYEIPAAEPNAIHGVWKDGPSHDFFKAIHKELGQNPFVAEDLGEIDQQVADLRDTLHLPGMKILQFGFTEDPANSAHLPHSHAANFIVYTGTHDNNTVLGWFRKETNKRIRQKMSDYVGLPMNKKTVVEEMIRLAYSSVSNIAIVPMQDVLGLDERACMNKPGSSEGNWQWRLLPGQISPAISKKLKHWTEVYGRQPNRS